MIYFLMVTTTIEEGRGQSINFRLLTFTPGCAQRHCPKFNTLPPVTVGRTYGTLPRD